MKIRSPASSANLGPGFDVLGLALGRYAWVADDEHRNESEPCDKFDIARIAFEAAGGTGPIWLTHQIEQGRGLGFSAAARSAGVMLALAKSGMPVAQARDAAFPIVSELEGHCDNAAASLYGGLCISGSDWSHQVTGQLPGSLVFWVPNQKTATKKSRKLLSSNIELEDASFNLARVGLLMSAIYESNAALLSKAMQDRLHQDKRFSQSPASEDALRVGIEAGALAGWLSGSGPSVGFLVPSETDSPVNKSTFENLGSKHADCKVLTLAVDYEGSVLDDSITP